MSDDERKKSIEPSADFEWKDYVAIVIAMFETTLLPIVIAVVLLILLVLFMR
jgi:hypothetical protein